MARAKRRDYYEVLGVAKDADDAELKRAFRELARRHHPDVNPDPKAGEKFREINEAYAVLSDRDQRARYDRWGHRGSGGAAEAGGFGAVAQAVEDVLGDVLRRRRSKQRGRDLRYTLEITFEEAAFGCTKAIKVPDGVLPDGADGPVEARDNRSASERGRGTGSTATTPAAREFSVVVPPGTTDGAIKLLRGEGEPGRGGAGPGDLNVIVRVKEHPILRRDGNDVWSNAVVSFPEAALGAVIDVPTLDGPVKMRVPEGSQPGRVFRIRGRGVPRAAGKNAIRGDHLVKLTVNVPSELTPRQRELIEELAGVLGQKPALAPRKRFLDRVRSLLDE